jgi:hypothetical protein
MASNRRIITGIAIIALCAFASIAGAGEFTITEHQGDVLIRPVGNYFWTRIEPKQKLAVGNRIRVRQGQFKFELPQGTVHINTFGEADIPVKLVDGIAQTWQSSVKLYIGNYNFLLNDETEKQPLKVKTLFGEVKVAAESKFTIRVTPKGSIISVHDGSVQVNHLRAEDAKALTLRKGEKVKITSQGFKKPETQRTVIAMR